MGLIRCLHFITARFDLLLRATHIAGIENSLADALSRNNLPFFFNHHSQANRTPSSIPSALLDLLVHSRPDWTSPTWNTMFNTTFNQHLPKTQCAPTHLATEGISVSALSQEPSLSPHQNLCSANLSATLASSSSNTNPLSATCPVSVFSKSSTLSLTPS